MDKGGSGREVTQSSACRECDPGALAWDEAGADSSWEESSKEGSHSL